MLGLRSYGLPFRRRKNVYIRSDSHHDLLNLVILIHFFFTLPTAENINRVMLGVCLQNHWDNLPDFENVFKLTCFYTRL